MTEFMHLKIYVEDEDLRQRYQIACLERNEKAFSNHPDAGFDLFSPVSVDIEPGSLSVKLKQGVKCAAYIGEVPVSFYMYPRSSMGSKTTLRLSNSVGIIDSGYRGELMGIVDNVGNSVQSLTQETRLFQIVAPNLMPIFTEIVESASELGSTARGEGGFGSTGGILPPSPRRASP